jgi:hypothetical protein
MIGVDLSKQQLAKIGITTGLLLLLVTAYYSTGLYINYKKIKQLNSSDFDNK